MFLLEPPPSAAVEGAYAEDLERDGYVYNHTRLWSHRPDVSDRFAELQSTLMAGSGLTRRERAVLLVAAVSVRGDSYCALARGSRLARLTDPDVAADPNATDQSAVDRLFDAGLSVREVFEATAS